MWFAFPNIIEKFRSYVEIWEQTAGLDLLMGPGLYSWVLVIYCGNCFRKRNKDALLKLMPLILLMFGFLLTHVNAETRYAFPLMASAPLIFACSRTYLYRDLNRQEYEEDDKKAGKETVGTSQ